MTKDLDRVIEYAQKRINQAYDDLNNQRGNILTLNQSIKDHGKLIKFCNQLKSEQPKSEQPKQKDGNECIGMEVRYVGKTYPAFTNNEWYPCVGNYNGLCAFIDNNGTKAGCHPCNQLSFDIDNPRPIQNK